MAGPFIWSGIFAKSLKGLLNLNDEIYILSGTADPTSSAQNAPQGSIYFRRGGSGGTAFLKQDAGSSTNWTSVSGATSITTSVTAGENLTALDAVYLSAGAGDGGRTAGRAYRVETGDANRRNFVGFITATVTSGNTATIQIVGRLTGFAGLVAGNTIYSSTSTIGGYQTTAPSGAGQGVIPLGIALTTTDLVVNGALGITKTANAGFMSRTKGYQVGGAAAGDTPQSTIEDIVFATDTSAQIATGYGATIVHTYGCSSSTKGYILGGTVSGSDSTNIKAFTFSGETIATLAATLDTARNGGAGVQSSTKGYAISSTGLTSIEDITFATEASVTILATLTAIRAGGAGTQSSTDGYVMGGAASGNASTNVAKLNFAAETTSNLVGVLSVSYVGGAGLCDSLRGYIIGGDDNGGNYRTAINAITFSTESVGAVTDTLGSTRSGGTGSSNPGSAGYLMGGRNGGTYSNVITKFTYATETDANIAATIDTARERANNAEIEY